MPDVGPLDEGARDGGAGRPVIDVGQPPVVLRVYGTPRPQGSKLKVSAKFYREGGSAAAHKAFTTWRQGIGREAARWLMSEGHPEPYDGPVRLDTLFLLAKPPSRPKSERFAATGFDDDKLRRAVGDGITVNARLLSNDARICWGESAKLWAVDTEPGCVLRIEALRESDWRRCQLVDVVWGGPDVLPLQLWGVS